MFIESNMRAPWSMDQIPKDTISTTETKAVNIVNYSSSKIFTNGCPSSQLAPADASTGSCSVTADTINFHKSATSLTALESKHDLIDLTLYEMRGYDLAQHMLSQHGAVSKLFRTYRPPGLIGGSKPKVATPTVVAKIEQYKQENPTIFAWEIRERLISEGACTNTTAPSVSSINRILRNRAAEKAAADFARVATYGMYPAHPYTGFSQWYPSASADMWQSGCVSNILCGRNRVSTTLSEPSPSPRSRCPSESLVSAEEIDLIDIEGEDSDCADEDQIKFTRNRTTFSSQKHVKLEKEFDKSNFPCVSSREKLASQITLSDARVQTSEMATTSTNEFANATSEDTHKLISYANRCRTFSDQSKLDDNSTKSIEITREPFDQSEISQSNITTSERFGNKQQPSLIPSSLCETSKFIDSKAEKRQRFKPYKTTKQSNGSHNKHHQSFVESNSKYDTRKKPIGITHSIISIISNKK